MEISFNEFKKVELRVGRILAAEKMPETDKLLRLTVDFGLKQPENAPRPPEHPLKSNVLGEKEQAPAAPAAGAAGGASFLPKPDIRQIISGIALSFPEPALLVGTTCLFATNLEPRVIKGAESGGMILTVANADKLALLVPTASVPPGTPAH